MRDKLYKLMNWPEIEAICYGESSHPQDILGRHSVPRNTLFQAFIPNVKQVKLCLTSDNDRDAKEYVMEMADEEGFYAYSVLGKFKGSYYYVVTTSDNEILKITDPYDIDVRLKGDDLTAFASGKAVNAYEFMGAHEQVIDGVSGVVFRVWAPNAVRVSVVGDFNAWNGKACPMMKDDESGIFSLFIPGLKSDLIYKYEILSATNKVYTKLDPYATKTTSAGSVVSESVDYKWNDADYLATRKLVDRIKASMNVYEMEFYSILDKNGSLTDKNISKLISRLSTYNYNYVEFIIGNVEMFSLPVDKPSVCKLVSKLHDAGIGVLYRFNPSYFHLLDEGLGIFDGTYLYGHLDERRRYNPSYGGFYFNYGRGEVLSYLMSIANYYMSEFHFDGYFIEGLSSMLYLDYGKYDGEWVANIYGGHENLEAIDYIKRFNEFIHSSYPYAITVTKEEGAFPKVTASITDGGLGFDYIINNGFSDDYHEFLSDKNLNKLTDSMAYAYCENYVVALNREDELDGAIKRATLAYLMARPGKKLIYQGQDDDKLSKDLNSMYMTSNALSDYDARPEGFEWVKFLNTGDGVIAFLRKDEYIDHTVLVVCNFSDNSFDEYTINIPYEGKYTMHFTSEDKKYGGASTIDTTVYNTIDEFDGRNNTLSIPISAMSVSFYEYAPYTEKELLQMAEEKIARYKEFALAEAKKKAKELKSKTSRA